MTQHKWRTLANYENSRDNPDPVSVFVDEEGIVHLTYELFSQLLREVGWAEQLEVPT